jgi:tRNA uracil 4-sulfurtransferase
MTRAIVLRWAEIFLKGGNRPFFEKKLVDNVRRAVREIPGSQVHKQHGRILVTTSEEQARRTADAVGRVFGVQNLSPAVVVPRAGAEALDPIAAEAVAVAEKAVVARGRKPTFKIETRRPDKRFPLTSQDVSREIGARVVAATQLPVDVHRPELTIGIEIAEHGVLVFSETIPGPGGLPVGATGRVNLLLSGGIDSPVAGWLAMKRGCTVGATYFHSFPYTGDKTKEKVIDLARLLAGWQGEVVLHVVGFTDVQKALREAGRGDLAVVLYRRMMMRAAARIAAAEHALALVTGENLAQVASQTLENLAAIEDASPLPVLRPLLTYDKLETIALARRIGTYETSILPYEDCCSLFVPDHPATRAHLADVHEGEAKLPIDSMAEALAKNAERIVVR